MRLAPHFSIDMDAFWHDPYPILERVRCAGPVVFVPELDGVVMCDRDVIDQWEKRIDVFSSEQPGGLMTELMGKNMMRCDGESHQAQRRQMAPAVSPRAVANHWRVAFEDAARLLLDELAPAGEADICVDYAMLLSGEALRLMTGLNNVTAQQMDAYSQAMIDGIANYQNDPNIRQKCVSAVARLDAAIDERMAEFHADPPDANSLEGSTIIAVLLRADAPAEQLRANVKLAISGGQNEPRDAIAGAVYALLSHPEQLKLVGDGTVSWDRVFEEYVRWMSPIGMSPRRIASDAVVEGVTLKEGGRAFFMFGAGNRDPKHFVEPENFDITRNTKKHIAFGAGPHFCAGAFASRALVANVALPMLFARFPDIHLTAEHEYKFGGWAFRGPTTVPVEW